MRTILLTVLFLPTLTWAAAPAVEQEKEQRREESREEREAREKQAQRKREVVQKRKREADQKHQREAEEKRRRELKQKPPLRKAAPHPAPRPPAPILPKRQVPPSPPKTAPVPPRPVAARPVSSYLPPPRRLAPLPAPAPLTHPKQFVREWTPPPAPTTLPGGAPAAAAASAPPPATHPASNPALTTAVVIQEREETAPNRYYWHHDGGMDYVHYVLNGHDQWWGFYVGGAYYWSRWHHGRWWWRDPQYDRVVSLRDGYWWWQDPDRPQALYVYINGGYVPYQAAATLSAPPPAPAIVATAPAAGAPRTTNVVVGVAPAAPAFSSDVDEPRYALKTDPTRLALVIGVEDYASLPKAEFASRDALTVAEHLRHLGFADRNLAVIVGTEAARGSVAKFVEGWLPDHADADSRVFVYFSGHGAPDPKTGETYLMPWDGDAKYLGVTGYRLKALYEKLNALPAKEVVVVLDACFSGAGGRSVLPEGARPLVTKADLGRSSAGKAVVFAASGGDEITGTAAKQGHGLFTYYLLKGLNGEARESADGVTVQDLYDYLRPQVEDAARRDGRDQTPQLLVPPDGQRGLLIKDLR